jgi:hypothetical protein
MPLDCTLAVDATGDRVAFALTVVNGGNGPVELAFRDSGKADFAVLASGDEVWRWSEGRMFAQVTQQVDLAPGEQITFDGEWTDPAPGDYTAVGELRSRSHDCESRAAFSV